jgi:hypothetical protein
MSQPVLLSLSALGLTALLGACGGVTFGVAGDAGTDSTKKGMDAASGIDAPATGDDAGNDASADGGDTGTSGDGGARGDTGAPGDATSGHDAAHDSGHDAGHDSGGPEVGPKCTTSKCTDVSECAPPPAGGCADVTCTSGCCQAGNLGAGTACSVNGGKVCDAIGNCVGCDVDGDCTTPGAPYCSAAHICVECRTKADCPTVIEECEEESCSASGTCTETPAPTGTACGTAGFACTAAGLCCSTTVTGECLAGAGGGGNP